MATELKRGNPLGAEQAPGLTQRKDNWWIGPAVTFLAYSAFVIYATFRVFENAHYVVGPYHSPFGSPDLRMFVPFLAALPFTVSPAMLILPFPAGFRFTCYYYRKSYYRAFYGTPVGCAVKPWGAKSHGGNRDYEGETGILAFQNLHRYFLYAAIVIVFILLYDAFLSIYYNGAFRFGVGSAILFLNVFLLGAYTFGCHALRHLVGGKLDCFSCDKGAQTRYKVWRAVTRLNERHAVWAWASLISVALSDVYIRWVSVNDMLGVWWV